MNDSLAARIARGDKLECPSASELPEPLMHDYLRLINAPGTTKTPWSPGYPQISDYFSVDSKEQHLFVAVNRGADLSDTNSVTFISNHQTNQRDYYAATKRAKVDFTSNVSHDATSVLVSATLDLNSPVEKISHENGFIYAGTQRIKNFQVDFDQDGRVTNYLEGSNSNNMVASECIKSDK